MKPPSLRKYFVAAIAILSTMVGCGRPGGYETMIQINPATEPGHVFVLVVLANLNDERDTANFVLEPGESAEQVERNRFLSDHRYEFEVDVGRTESGGLGVRVVTQVSMGEDLLYRGTSTLGGFVLRE